MYCHFVYEGFCLYDCFANIYYNNIFFILYVIIFDFIRIAFYIT